MILPSILSLAVLVSSVCQVSATRYSRCENPEHERVFDGINDVYAGLSDNWCGTNCNVLISNATIASTSLLVPGATPMLQASLIGVMSRRDMIRGSCILTADQCNLLFLQKQLAQGRSPRRIRTR